MCGILYTDRDVDLKLFVKAVDLMRYRGPDNTGTETVNNRRFGQQRLKILGLREDSNQPFHSQSGKHVIIYNGEVYNFRELSEKHSIPLPTDCDTELVVELYEKKGPDFLKELNGMFALVICNTETGALFVARDRLGIKPLYYSDMGGLTFSSEPAPLKLILGNTSIDETGLRQYKKLRTFFNGRTLYNEIKIFPAAHYYDNGRFVRYWELPRGPQDPPTDEELSELMKASVRYRKISDVPVGSYLSGGLDSTLVTGLARVDHSWTVGQAGNNEFEWGEMAAEHFGTIHHAELVSSDSYVPTLKKMVETRQEPLSVPNEVLIYLMTKRVKEKNTVVLSGEGADELFFGYDRIFRWAARAGHWDLATFSDMYSYSHAADLEIVEDAVAPFMDRGKPIDIVAAFFQVSHLHGLLRRLDFATMLCSVEARVPFVDHRLVERMAGVPFDFRMARGEVKAPLKRISRGVVPDAIIDRKKIGFPVDLNAVFGKNTEFKNNMDEFFKINLSTLGVGDP